MFLYLLLFLQLILIKSDIVGWWVGDNLDNTEFLFKDLNFHAYTHIRYGSPISFSNSSVMCNKTDTKLKRVLSVAHGHNIKVQWGGGIKNIHEILWNPEMLYLEENYLNTIGKAVTDCGVDGIEVDYEFGDNMKLGIVTPNASTRYSQFLAGIKTAVGPDKIVSADISIWGVAPGNWLLGVLPWINASMLNAGAFDFINTMSYHWNKDGNLWSWKKDTWFIDQWGIDRDRVNIGIPYFSMNRTKDFKVYNEPTWGGLSHYCPNISKEENICNGVVFVGKEMNYNLGVWIREQGFRGAFPWAANYDSNQFNNSLVNWLNLGLK